MGAYQFGLGYGKVSEREQARVRRVIRSLDLGARCEFVAVDSVGVGTRYWFSAENRGCPFDQDLANRVLAAVGRIKTKQANGRYA